MIDFSENWVIIRWLVTMRLVLVLYKWGQSAIAAQSALAQHGPNNIQPELITELRIISLDSFLCRPGLSRNVTILIGWFDYIIPHLMPCSAPGPLINDGHWIIARNNDNCSPAIGINYIFTVWGDIIIIIWCQVGASVRISGVSSVQDRHQLSPVSLSFIHSHSRL